MQDNMKHNNIRIIIGIPEGEEEEQGIEHLFEKVNRNYQQEPRGNEEYNF